MHHQLLLGAHTSITGGFEQALIRGASIGCTALQIFTKSNRQWAAVPITPEQAQRFKKVQRQVNIHHVIAHATYLINIASPDADTHKKSTQAVITELERCHALGIGYLVLHPGASLATSPEKARDQLVSTLKHIFDHTPADTAVLLENMAGQGSSMCSSFEELGYIIHKVNRPSRLGVCFDTCHAFAAGYDFTTPAAYKKMWDNFDTHIGMKNL